MKVRHSTGSGLHLMPVLPILLGIGLFICNNLAIIAGWLHTPPGFEPMFLHGCQSVAQYMTWIEGFRFANVIPNYHAPWQTEPATLPSFPG